MRFLSVLRKCAREQMRDLWVLGLSLAFAPLFVFIYWMWTGGNAPDCADDAGAAGWVRITDPESLDIFAFSVDDDLSYEETILDNGVDTVTQRVRKLRMDMQGQLVLDNTIQRHIVDVIDVRNDLLL